MFEDGAYCRETFYRIDEKRGNSAAVDIKLFAFARGRGIAARALSFAMEDLRASEGDGFVYMERLL